MEGVFLGTLFTGHTVFTGHAEDCEPEKKLAG